MKINLSFPGTAQSKCVDIDDDNKLRFLNEKRMGAEVPLDGLGDDFAGYVGRITAGNDKQGFPMMQGVLAANRVRLLFSKGMRTFRERRKGCRKRKSVRGCIVSHDIQALSLSIVKKGEKDIEGLTNEAQPKRRGPKRASKIRKMFSLEKGDDVCKFVVRRCVEKGEKKKWKAAKVQRLITPQKLQHARQRRALKLAGVKNTAEEYAEWVALKSQRKAEAKEARHLEAAKKKKKLEGAKK